MKNSLECEIDYREDKREQRGSVFQHLFAVESGVLLELRLDELVDGNLKTPHFEVTEKQWLRNPIADERRLLFEDGFLIHWSFDYFLEKNLLVF